MRPLLVTAFINGLKKIYPGWENYPPALDIGRKTSLPTMFGRPEDFFTMMVCVLTAAP